MEDEISLKSNALSKQYGPVKAVDSVSLTVKKREQFGLIGPNGAGKSSLMKMLTHYIAPHKGRCFYQWDQHH